MPRRKAAALRENRETLDVGLLIDLEPEVAEPPPPPAGLTAIVERAWAAYWLSPLARLVKTGTDLMALRRLFLMYDEAERGMMAFRRVRVVEGSTGQLRLNPALKAVDPGDLLQLEDRFGLSPKSRLALGVVLGDATRSLEDLADPRRAPEDDGAPDEDAFAVDW